MGIEPTSEAWEASILPLYDARSFPWRADYTQPTDSTYRPAILHFPIPCPKTRPAPLLQQFLLRIFFPWDSYEPRDAALTQCRDKNTNDAFHLTSFSPDISSIPFISQNMRLRLVPLRKWNLACTLTSRRPGGRTAGAASISRG
jgi:hypothetical protein